MSPMSPRMAAIMSHLCGDAEHRFLLPHKERHHFGSRLSLALYFQCSELDGSKWQVCKGFCLLFSDLGLSGRRGAERSQEARFSLKIAARAFRLLTVSKLLSRPIRQHQREITAMRYSISMPIQYMTVYEIAHRIPDWGTRILCTACK
jgi:hypothetical protein